MFGGVLACGLTHASVVTLDVAKCRTQAHSKSGAWPNGLFSSIGKTWELEGFHGITKGKPNIAVLVLSQRLRMGSNFMGLRSPRAIQVWFK